LARAPRLGTSPLAYPTVQRWMFDVRRSMFVFPRHFLPLPGATLEMPLSPQETNGERVQQGALRWVRPEAPGNERCRRPETPSLCSGARLRPALSPPESAARLQAGATCNHLWRGALGLGWQFPGAPANFRAAKPNLKH
jgi:hypothetical protein